MKALMLRKELPERGTKTLELDDGRAILLVHENGRIHGYLNQCPHLGVELNWKPDQVRDASGQYLQCAMHGALFRPEDGFCVEGPCAGQSLTRIAITEKDGKLFTGLPDEGA